LNNQNAGDEYFLLNDKQLAQLANGHFIFTRVKGLEEYCICLYRKTSRSIYNSSDFEYVNSLVKQIRQLRQGMQSLVADKSLVPIIRHISNNLENILYINVKSPYCLVFHDSDQPNDREEFRISLQNLTYYFKEEDLLQVHRSYLINPSKIKSFHRKPTSAYEVIIQGTFHSEIRIPVGRGYIEKLKRHLGQSLEI
ncbi:MAG: LytTR family transcriptional regulator DNA-binding domain-containing protein, partial [Proteobacteria bacterium]|nr:LytTR family transcriptional regulator DNA-binding domain-containing protein [Pseudomonadota bacterium]